MTKTELEAQMREVLMPVAPEDWLIERCCNLAELYARQQNGAKPFVKCRLYEVRYHSSYAVWHQQTASFLANNEAEALDKFWANKNKESYEVMSVCLVNGT